MSLKSFDKMCENMILGKTGAEKEIYDERQNQVRTKLTVEALLVYIVSVFVNSLVMELIYQWCESYCAPMILLVVICYLYWIIRNWAKGSLFGVKGAKAAKYTAFLTILYGFLFGLQFLFPLLDNEQNYFFLEGKATKEYVFAITWLLLLISGIIIFVLAKRNDKKGNNGSET